jgi:hypothetical protein
MLEALFCRVFNHKWERIRGVEEEAYQCRRWGERRYGKQRLLGEVADRAQWGPYY